MSPRCPTQLTSHTIMAWMDIGSGAFLYLNFLRHLISHRLAAGSTRGLYSEEGKQMPGTRNIVRISIVLLITLSSVLADHVLSKGSSLKSTSISQKGSGAIGRLQQEDVIHIDDRGLTEREKAHSRLFQHHGSYDMRALAKELSGDIIVEDEEPLVAVQKNDPAQIQRYIVFTTCNADVIVVGRLKSKSPQFTEEGSFIFTDHELTVEELIKNYPNSSIQRGSSIQVTREGGALEMNGRVYRAIQRGFNPFVVGNRYLLFLRAIPSTGSYLAYVNGSFGFEAGSLAPFGQFPPEEPRDTARFLAEINSVGAAGNCSASRH